MDSFLSSIPTQLFRVTNTSSSTSNSSDTVLASATSDRAVRGSSVQLEVWVPALVLSHVFALYWLLKALTLFKPGVWRQLQDTLNRFLGRQADLSGVNDSDSSSITGSWDVLAEVSQPDPPAGPLPKAASLDLSPPMGHQTTTSRWAKVGRPHPPATAITPRRVQSRSELLTSSKEGGKVAPNYVSVRSSSKEDDKPRKVIQDKNITSFCTDASAAAVCLAWRGIGCCYDTPSGSKVVLEEVWGEARSGEMQVRDGVAAIELLLRLLSQGMIMLDTSITKPYTLRLLGVPQRWCGSSFS